MNPGSVRSSDAAGTLIGAIVVRTDAVRKRLAGVPLRERVDAGFGEEETGLVYLAFGHTF